MSDQMQPSILTRLLVLGISLSALTCAGCGGGEEKHPETVTGTWQVAPGSIATFAEDGSIMLDGKSSAPPFLADLGENGKWRVDGSKLVVSGTKDGAEVSHTCKYWSDGAQTLVLQLPPQPEGAQNTFRLTRP